MAQVIRRMVALAALLVCFGSSSADAQVPSSDAALAAEGEGRWDDAIRMHQAVLAADPTRTDVLIRIADIEARRGNLPASIAALQRAATTSPEQTSIYYRLSQAYSSAGQPSAALMAVEGALALEPDSTEFLRAHATLATWLADYDRAHRSYQRLVALQPDDMDLALAYARVSAWRGDTDEAVVQYERYLKARPDDGDAAIDLAKTESWRGNYAGAMRALAGYRARFGETAAYSQAVASVMAGADRPDRAQDVVTPLLAENPDSFELNLTRTIALALQRRAREAFSSLDAVRQLGPDRMETRSAERVVRTMLASTAEPQVTAYSDSDHLAVERFAPKATIALLTGTTLSGGYERTHLEARPGSGLDQANGAAAADYQHSWVGVGQKLGRVTLDGQAGYAVAEGTDLVTYAIGAETRPTDSLRLSVRRMDGAVVVSPRTVGLALTQTVHRVQADWTPTLQSTIAFDASYAALSDGNHRLEITLSPRRSVARRAAFNLDLGVSAYRLETERDLTNGYYDPARYELYGVTVFPYFKVTENIGLSLSSVLGAQRDSVSPGFHFGGTVSGEATFGIYEPWVVKINSSVSVNQRLESGAFRGVSAGVVLVRRF